MADLLEISGLCTQIELTDAVVRAVDDVSFSVGAGECLGLVGESGCGKTMTARSIMRLLPPGGVITDGSIVFDGTDLTQLSEPEMQQVRGRDIGLVFQDPSSALDPTMTIGNQIAESVIIHNAADPGTAAQRAVQVLGLVRMPEPERAARQYPHELSGGMRQRAMIAAALACEPRLLIADEPTTALDVTIQREILELIDDLRVQLGMAVILVTHDLGVIGGRTDKVAVMYGGRIIEQAATRAVFGGPRHPYTEALFEALPELAGPASRALYSIPGRPPDLTAAAAGCSFAPRCRYTQDWCTAHRPALDGDHPAHTYACFFPVGAAGPDRGGTAASNGARPLSAWLTHRDPSARRSRPATEANGTGDAAAAPSHLRVAGLVKDYPVTGGLLRRQTGAVSAVAGVSFELPAGQTLGLVGESGCGKTTVARLLAGLERADAGSVLFGGTDLARLSRRQRRRHGAGIQLMFQDAFGSLDPRMRVRSIRRRRPAAARVLGRPAAAAGAGPRADPAARGDRGRRAGLGPRRLGAGADTQPDAQTAAPVRAQLPADLTRPVGDPLHGRHHRGDVPRQAGRDRPGRGGLRGSWPPVHPGPHRGGPCRHDGRGAGCGRRRAGRRAAGGH
jgi:peptide/nickel transport system ATP-binding protein